MNRSKRYTNPSVEQIDEILDRSKVIAVVGLSSSPDRPSYGVANYLKKGGYRIIPVNPKEKEVLGEKAYFSLKDISQKIDMVNIFRRPEFVPAIMDEAIEVGVKVIWMQQGVVNDETSFRATEEGLKVVMDRCIAQELNRHTSI